MTLHSIIDQFDLLMDAPDSVPRLRQFILQLAVQGQLTEQDSSDEPAEQLLERIRKRKKQWLEENDSPRRRSLGDFPDETPFELPLSWKWTRLDDVSIYIQRGKSPDYAEVEEIPVVSQKCIQWVGFQSSRVRFIDPNSLEGYQDYRFLRSGDLLWNSTGVGTVGRVNVYQGELSDYRHVVADSHVTVVRTVKDFVLPDYVYCWIASAYIQGRIDSEMTSGSTKQTELNTTTVRETLVPLPPLEEQQRIVATVDRLMEACDTLEAQQAAAEQVRVRCTAAATHALQTADTPAAVRTAWHRLRNHFDALCATPDDVDALRQTILQLAVQGNLTEQDPSDEPADQLLERIQAEKQRLYDEGEIRKPKGLPSITDDVVPFEIPSNWVWTHIAEICNLENGDRSKNYPKRSELVDSGIPFINAGHLQDGEVDFTEMNYIPEARFEILRSGKVTEDDVLFCLRGSLGKCAIINDIKRGAIASSLVIVRPFLEFASDYLLMYFGSALCEQMIDHYDNGTAQPNLGSSSLAEFLIPLPPAEEQKRIVATVDRLMDVCDTLEAQLSRQQTLGIELLDAVLHHASFIGERTALVEA